MKTNPEDEKKKKPYKISLPINIPDKEIGLGDVLKRVSARFGFSACSGCDRRARSLNRWIRFSARR